MGGTTYIAEQLLDATDNARQFLSKHSAQTPQLHMRDLSEEDAATAQRLADACSMSCMQIWGAAIHHDVAQHIHSTLAQHVKHELAPVQAPARRSAKRRSAARATAAPAWQPNGSFSPLLAALDDTSNARDERLVSIIERLPVEGHSCGLEGPDDDSEGVDDLLVGTSYPHIPAEEPQQLLQGSWDSLAHLKYTAPAPVATARLRSTGSNPSGRFNAPEAAVAIEQLRQGQDPDKLLALAQRCDSTALHAVPVLLMTRSQL